MRCRSSRVLLSRVVMMAASCWAFVQLINFIIADDGSDGMTYKEHEDRKTLFGPFPRGPRPVPEPVLVCMVTYQRSGSSFLGEVFNQNPAAFEWFEPFDGLYSAMYGTEYGHNVPADIWNYWSGAPRKLPIFEIEALARVAKDILTCNFIDIPTEVRLHHFIGMFIHAHRRLEPYHKCTEKKPSFMGTRATQMSCRRCNLKLMKICGRRFGDTSKNQEMCARALIPGLFKGGNWTQVVSSSFKTDSISEAVNKGVAQYRSCMRVCEQKAADCMHHLSTVCDSAPIRAIKPVRFPMEAAQRLQELLPNVKLIHNLRDPRAVVASRKNTSSSFQAAYAGALLKPPNSKHDIIKEARLFCRNALEHVKLFREMSLRKPESTLQVIYEKYAQKPKEMAQTIYKFLGLPVPNEVMLWLDENTTNMNKSHQQTTRNSSLTSSKWQNLMKADIKVAINKICADLLTITGHLWS